MSEKVYRLNEKGLLLYVREDTPTQWRGLLLYVREDIPNQSTGSALVCQKRYTDSMEGVCFCMSERIYRLKGAAVEEDPMEGVCFCVAEKIYRLNEGGLLLYVREYIPTQ